MLTSGWSGKLVDGIGAKKLVWFHRYWAASTWVTPVDYQKINSESEFWAAPSLSRSKLHNYVFQMRKSMLSNY